MKQLLESKGSHCDRRRNDDSWPWTRKQAGDRRGRTHPGKPVISYVSNQRWLGSGVRIRLHRDAGKDEDWAGKINVRRSVALWRLWSGTSDRPHLQAGRRRRPDIKDTDKMTAEKLLVLKRSPRPRDTWKGGFQRVNLVRVHRHAYTPYKTIFNICLQKRTLG